MIVPTPADIGRKVKLPRFNEAPLIGELVEARVESDIKNGTSETVAMVLYEDMGMPVATDCAKLEWA